MDRDYLIIKLKSLLMDVIEVESYNIEFNEDLRKRNSWDIGCEKDFEKGIKEELIEVELSKLNPLTLDKIADAILKGDIPGLPDEKEQSLDLALLKLFMG